MIKSRLDELKGKIVGFKEVCADMNTLAEAINKLPKGQLKKILTDEIKEILKKYGVEI